MSLSRVSKKLLLVISLALLLPAVAVSGQDTAKGNIHPNFRLSFTERFRLVTWDYTINLRNASWDVYSFTRHRTSLMGQWFLASDIEFALKLTNEFRSYFAPVSQKFTLDEAFVDLLYAKWNIDSGFRGTLTLGRQNIILGEGFLVMDGGPLDGSRSIYFNAARFDWKLDKAKSLSLFYMYQEETDEWLPILHDQDKPMVDQPEEGFGAYFSGDFAATNLQAYAIRKNVKETATQPAASEINTFGGRVQVPAMEKLSATIEAAYQFGKLGDADRAAFGGYTHLDYTTGWAVYLPSALTAGAVYLSGDDPETGDWEGWDPLFARWPKWSESSIYTLIREGGVAYWSNFASAYVRVGFKLSDQVRVQGDFQHLIASQVPDTALSFPGGTGKTRGELLIGKMTFQINDRLSGHLLWETFFPGNFYFDEAVRYSWVRVEFMLKL
ncbi:MAG: alginate export family protein [candidate division Zixibacteria bacterium]|nr:alginate export family protein [candidate division Zixibacteria bacterium]